MHIHIMSVHPKLHVYTTVFLYCMALFLYFKKTNEQEDFLLTNKKPSTILGF